MRHLTESVRRNVEASKAKATRRAGHVTAATKAGKRRDRIMAQTDHKSERVFAGYVRQAELFVDNAAEGIGL